MGHRVWSCAVVFVMAVSAHAGEPQIKVGLLENMFQDVPRPVLNAMAEPFKSLMVKQTMLDGDVEICPNFQTMAKKLKDQKLSVGVFHGYEYAWAKQVDDKLTPLLVTIPHGRKAQSMIVVRADSEIKTVVDLKGKTIIMAKGTKAYSRLYLDRLKAQHKEISVSTKPVTMTSEEALSAVAGGLEAATITDAQILHGYQLLQPGHYKNLRILCESELFPCSVIAAEKGVLSDADMQKIITGLSTANKNAQGRAMLSLWGLKGFEKAPEGYDDHCKKIIAVYPPPK